MDVLRTLIWFIYFFGYLVVHIPALRRGERALAAGDNATVDALVQKHVPHWCSVLLRLAGVTVTVEGRENIPAGRPSVFVANHRSYYDIPLMLTALDAAHPLVAKQEINKLPLVRSWMKLLRCVFVQRDDVRASLRALNAAQADVENGYSVSIFPEGTRFKGPEGGIGEFKGGAFRIATHTGAPLVPVAMSHTRDVMENNHMLMHPTHVTVRILPPIETAGLAKDALRALPARVQEEIRQNLLEAEQNPYHPVFGEARSLDQLAPKPAGKPQDGPHAS